MHALAAAPPAQNVISASQSAALPHPEGARLLMVMPFDNASNVPGIDWIGESFPEVLGRGFASAPVYIIGREERLYAFDRLGLPLSLRPSRATLLRIAQEMDVDLLVVGSYTFDGRTFTARAELTDMRRLRLLPAVSESGALPELIDVQNLLTWDLLKQFEPDFATPKQQFVTRFAPIRLDAFENYIRGITDTVRADKVKHFKEALRIDPDYSQAMMQLGLAYFHDREYEPAANWFAKVPRNESIANEANFYLGLSSIYLGHFDRAEEAFRFVADRIPLIEVINDLGVAEARKGAKSAAGLFERAAQADTRDEDYQFNLAAALYADRDTAGAMRALKAALALRPDDTEARSLLDSMNAGQAPQHAPLERIKANYDETSYRQLALEIQNVQERRMLSAPPAEHAAYHVQQGEQLLHSGETDLAENDFREAILLDPALPDAHLGLAQSLFARNDIAAARAEDETSLHLNPSAAAYVLLAQIEASGNHTDAARDAVERALRLSPNDAAALGLQKKLGVSVAAPAKPPE